MMFLNTVIMAGMAIGFGVMGMKLHKLNSKVNSQQAKITALEKRVRELETDLARWFKHATDLSKRQSNVQQILRHANLRMVK